MTPQSPVAAEYPRRHIMRFVGLLMIVWLIAGVFAAYQREYFTNAEQSCASAGTIAVTVIAGPLNYVGVNPKVTNCNIPQPSS
jgi:hypothetical protein